MERDVHLGVHRGGKSVGSERAGGVCAEVAGPRAEQVWSDAGLAHVVAYGEGVAPERAVPGVLDDYAFVANAALDAWEASGEMRYFDAAQQIADAMLKRFYDVTGCGFFDTELNSTEERIGALTARRKPLQDAPTPAGNAVAATVLLRLAALTNNKDYETRAQETLETFGGVVEHFGLYAASYALALRRMIEPPIQVCVVGDDAVAKELLVTSMARFMVNKSVIQLRREQLQTLPPALAETLPNAPAERGEVLRWCARETSVYRRLRMMRNSRLRWRSERL